MNPQVVAGVLASGESDSAKSRCWVKLYELAQTVELVVPDYHTAAMTPEQARMLARQLYHLARRVEARQKSKEVTT